MSKNNLRGITLDIGPVLGIHSLTLIISWYGIVWYSMVWVWCGYGIDMEWIWYGSLERFYWLVPNAIAYTSNAFISIPKTTFSKKKVKTSLSRKDALRNCEFHVTKSLPIICESSISYLYSTGRLPRSPRDIGRYEIRRCWYTERWYHIHLSQHLHTRQYLHRNRKCLAINLRNIQVLSDSHLCV